MTRKEGQPGIINIRMWRGGGGREGRGEGRGKQSGEGGVLSYWDLYVSARLT